MKIRAVHLCFTRQRIQFALVAIATSRNHSSFVETKLYEIQVFICAPLIAGELHENRKWNSLFSVQLGNETFTPPSLSRIATLNSLLEFINEVIPPEKLTLFYMKWKRKLDLLESPLWKSPSKMESIFKPAKPLLFEMMSYLLN